MGGILEFRGRGGVSWTGIPNAWGGGGGNAVWNSKGMGGEVSALNSANFLREDSESFAWNHWVDLLTFLVCKSSMNEPQKQAAEVSVHTDGLCSKVYIEEALKLMN